jgi:serine/threonine protein kinase
MLAAKIILKEKMTDACFEKLNNEIRIGLLCRHHTHLCHVVDVLETNDSVIIIMRRVLHGNLIEHVHDRRLETGSDTLCEAEVKKLAQQLVEAVYELHSMGIAHRDIKLDNILVSCDGEVTLTDFGHAVMAPSTASTSGSPVLTMNDAIDIAGTHAYGSPQLRRGSNYNAFSADIWCVGIVLHVLLTGFFPFPDELPSEQMTTWYRPPSTASPECQKLLSTILTSEEASRPSARELRKMKWLTRNA